MNVTFPKDMLTNLSRAFVSDKANSVLNAVKADAYARQQGAQAHRDMAHADLYAENARKGRERTNHLIDPNFRARAAATMMGVAGPEADHLAEYSRTGQMPVIKAAVPEADGSDFEPPYPAKPEVRSQIDPATVQGFMRNLGALMSTMAVPGNTNAAQLQDAIGKSQNQSVLADIMSGKITGDRLPLALSTTKSADIYAPSGVNRFTGGGSPALDQIEAGRGARTDTTSDARVTAAQIAADQRGAAAEQRAAMTQAIALARIADGGARRSARGSGRPGAKTEDEMISDHMDVYGSTYEQARRAVFEASPQGARMGKAAASNSEEQIGQAAERLTNLRKQHGVIARAMGKPAPDYAGTINELRSSGLGDATIRSALSRAKFAPDEVGRLMGGASQPITAGPTSAPAPAAQPRPAPAPAAKQYRSAEDVRAAYQAGQIDKNAAASILRRDFGLK